MKKNTVVKYYEIAEGSVKNRNVVIPEYEINDKILSFQKSQQELYYSIWLYNNDILDHMKLNKTIRSYRGKCALQWIIFDIDKGEDTDEFVLRRAREFYFRLNQDWNVEISELIIYYSGTGYHIYMPNYFKFQESEFIRQEVKNTLKEYFPEIDLSIYGATGLIRAPYSLNRKTNNFKIQLTSEEFLTMGAIEIINLSSNNYIRKFEPYEEVDRDFSGYIVKATVEREQVFYRDEPTRIVTCMQHLYNKGAVKGTRHIEILRLVSAWRRQGLTQSASIELTMSWLQGTMEKYEVEKTVKDIYNKGYRYGCNDVVMSKYCDAKCIFYTHKNYTALITNSDEMENILSEFSIALPNYKFIDLQPILKLPNPYKIYQGEMVVFIGDTKLGKSTLIQNIVVNSSNLKFLYFPLENGKLLDTRRLLQVAHHMSKDEITDYYKLGNRGLVSKINHVNMVDSTVSLDDIRKLIIESDADVIVIDTVDQVQISKIEDYTAITNKLANGFRELSRNTNRIFLLVHHISKNAAMDSMGRTKRLTVHSSKGSSALEQKADKVIGIEGDANSLERIVTSLAARDESPFEKTVLFDKHTFTLIPEEL
jgi:archaellum biogenesis ATPase FlaH